MNIKPIAQRSHAERENPSNPVFDKALMELGIASLWHEEVKRINNASILGYHNNHHLYHVAFGAFNLAASNPSYSGSYTPLIIAGLFHDVDHLGSGLGIDDSVHIANAVKAWNSTLEGIAEGTVLVDESLQKFLSTKDAAKAIEELIIQTKYPYEDAGRDVGIQAAYLRDADLLYSLETNNMPELVTHGFFEEKSEVASSLSFKSFLEQQLDFFQSLKMHTPEGQYRLNHLRPLRINLLQKQIASL